MSLTTMPAWRMKRDWVWHMYMQKAAVDRYVQKQVRQQKGRGRPVYPLADRLDILSELQCIDYLVAFEEPTVRDLLRALRPDVYVKGGDYRAEQINEYDVVRELGLELRILAHRPGLGSTQVIERLNRAAEE